MSYGVTAPFFYTVKKICFQGPQPGEANHRGKVRATNFDPTEPFSQLRELQVHNQEISFLTPLNKANVVDQMCELCLFLCLIYRIFHSSRRLCIIYCQCFSGDVFGIKLLVQYQTNVFKC